VEGGGGKVSARGGGEKSNWATPCPGPLGRAQRRGGKLLGFGLVPGSCLPFLFLFFFFNFFFKRAFEQEQLKQKQNNNTKTIILQHECTIKFTKLMINFIFYKNYLFTKLNAHKNT